MSGFKLAILYGIRPHQLGFCGPKNKKDTQLLLDYLHNRKVGEKKIRTILKEFKGAYPYYELIAKSNKIKDPFDERVVRAYWVGNRLLEKDPKPYHCYHVFVVGSVTGRIVLKGKLLDLCRISWGKVKSMPRTETKFLVRGQKLKVLYQPFKFTSSDDVRLGKPIKKEIDWDKDLVPNVKIGDWVSFHWNQAVEVLTEKDRKNLEKYTKATLKSLQK